MILTQIDKENLVKLFELNSMLEVDYLKDKYKCSTGEAMSTIAKFMMEQSRLMMESPEFLEIADDEVDDNFLIELKELRNKKDNLYKLN